MEAQGETDAEKDPEAVAQPLAETELVGDTLTLVVALEQPECVTD